jgi:hypothetical protein
VTEAAERPEAPLPSQLQKPGPVLFTVLSPPAKPGDGWVIADEAKGPPMAFLLLPGEAPIYGGLDYMSPDERWPLEPGSWYAVPVTVSARPPRKGELPVLRATQAPARVPPPPKPAGKRNKKRPPRR